MSTPKGQRPQQKGYYNDAEDENLLDGTPTVENGNNAGAAGAAGAGTGTTTVPVSEKADPYAAFKSRNLDDFIKYTEAHTESEEERRKRERRERSQNLVNGIADMGRAIANLYFTNRYAPNAYDSNKSLSEASRKRQERAKAEREKERDWHMRYALQRAGLQQGDQSFNFGVEKARQAERRADEAAAEARRQFDETMEAKEKATELAAQKQAVAEQNAAADRQERERNHRAQEAIGWARVRNSGGRGSNSYETFSLEGGGYVRIPKEYMGGKSAEYNIKTIYDKVPADRLPEKYDSQGKEKRVSVGDMLQVIAANRNIPEVEAEMRKMGVVIEGRENSRQGNVTPQGGTTKQKRKTKTQI